ncbi:MAG: RDD family protein, partial [Candidatus Dormibacteraeota bacterium]|nr:RDD family protein [Candidatus Dormibacteraeota bacterium]
LIGGSPQPNGAAAGTSGLVALIYFAVFWSHLGGGRTVGMRLLRLRVVRTDMSPLSPGRAVIRFLGLWVSFLVCFAGVLWVAVDSRHQGWHDKMADSLVIRN